ncbi:MAG: hypothetical protein AAB373_03330 [Patescibacteria group bacterium]
MQKKLLSTFILLSLVFVGCGKKIDKETVKPVTDLGPYIYTNEFSGFTLEVPYLFTLTKSEEQEQSNQPYNAELISFKNYEYPGIVITSENVVKTLSYDEMLITEEAKFQDSCETIQVCSKVINAEEKIIGNITFLKLRIETTDKLTEKYQSDEPELSYEGKNQRIYYTFSKDDKFIEIEFYDPTEAAQSEFEKILETIKF